MSKREEKTPSLEAYDPAENHNIEIPHMKKNPELLLHKTNVFYGLSNNGKSTLNVEFLTWLKNDIPLTIVFSNSEESNEVYSKVIPGCLIYTELKRDMLIKIWDRQLMASRIWKQCQNLKILGPIFDKFADAKDRDEVKTCEQAKAEVAKKLKAIYEADPSKKSEIVAQITKLEEKHEEMLRMRFRETIRQKRRHILKANVSDQEREVATYLDFNPNILIIIDDFSAELKAMIGDKKENLKCPIIQNLFYKGRHPKVTAFLNFQSEKDLPPELRQNAHNSFFCSSQTAISYFSKGSNGFSNDQKKLAANITRAVFTPKEGHERTKFRKMAYLRNGSPQFQYVIADLHHGFRMGSPSLWEYSEQLARHTEKNITNSNNEFAKMFKL